MVVAWNDVNSTRVKMCEYNRGVTAYSRSVMNNSYVEGLVYILAAQSSMGPGYLEKSLKKASTGWCGCVLNLFCLKV